MSEQEKRRTVRSFVLRTGRMTVGQQNAYDKCWPRWGNEVADGSFDASAAFGREGPLVLEIGFGMGQSLVEMALAQPATNYLGIEVHKPGVGRLFHSCVESAVDNIRVYQEDALDVMAQCIDDNSLAGVQLYFPDPWPKKKHHKRRIVQLPFLAQVQKKLAPGAYLHMATDWEPYAEYMMEVVASAPGFVNRAGPGQFSERPSWRPVTKFERRGEKLGHGVWDILLEKTP